jgi:hypothetical protein
MKEAGYVYILTNPSFKEDWVKIGITSGTVEKRMKELYSTGVPLAFEKYASYETSKYVEVERFMHRSLSLLADNRINSNREFFRVKPQIALQYLMQIAELLGEGKVEAYVQSSEIAKSEIEKRQSYQDKEDWLKENNREDLRPLINKFTKIGFGYHLGISDLRIDFTPKGCTKAYNCLMLLGKRSYASFQPSELLKLGEFCKCDIKVITYFLESLRPYLDKAQKHTPYTLTTGYYNISHTTLIEKSDEIAYIYQQLITQLL